MRPFLAIACLFAVAASDPPALPVASRPSGTFTLARDAEARWTPFELTPGNQIRFAMTVDGRPMTAVLDTGVSYSVLAKRYADASRVTTLPAGAASAIGGSVDIGWVETRTLALAGLTRTGGGLVVTDLPAIATGSAQPIDILVGRDLTAGFALDIDYAAKRFRLIRSGRVPFAGVTAPLWIARDRLVYMTELTLGAARLRPMVVDTGDGSAVTVSEANWQLAKLPQVRTTTAISYGLGGAIISTIGIVPELRLGQLTARAVEVRVEPKGGFSDTIGVAGRVGSGFLQNYRVLLDAGAGHLVLQAGPGADQPPLRSTSGLLVGVARDRLRVLHVMRGGPAAATGWREGDEICRIDGVPIPADYATSAIAGWSADRPGRVVRLGLCSGTTRALTLSAFY